MPENPFETLESAHQYITLLREQVNDVSRDMTDDIRLEATNGASRHLDALRLVDYKLRQLDAHLTATSRLLNDLRVLRRLLFGEREEAPIESKTHA